MLHALHQRRSLTSQKKHAIMITSSALMTLLIIRQQNKKATYSNKYLALQLGILSPVHISVYIYSSSTGFSCVTTDSDRSRSFICAAVPVASTTPGLH